MIPEALIMTPLLTAGVFTFGLLIGSFLNVVIVRVPPRLEYDWRCQCNDLLDLPATNLKEEQPPGLVISRSRCPHCGHRITALENIPLASYFFLKGKCSSCHEKISPRYPIVELITAVLFLFAFLRFGFSPQLFGSLALIAGLIALSFIDIDHQLLPDCITLPMLWLGLVLSCFGVFTNAVDAIAGAVLGYGILWSIYHLFRLVTGKEGMGYGDFKLLAALGAWFGWQLIPLTILLSSFVGALVGTTLIVMKRNPKGQTIPFGPYIAIAGIASLLWGHAIVGAYLEYSGL